MPLSKVGQIYKSTRERQQLLCSGIFNLTSFYADFIYDSLWDLWWCIYCKLGLLLIVHNVIAKRFYSGHSTGVDLRSSSEDSVKSRSCLIKCNFYYLWWNMQFRQYTAMLFKYSATGLPKLGYLFRLRKSRPTLRNCYIYRGPLDFWKIKNIRSVMCFRWFKTIMRCIVAWQFRNFLHSYWWCCSWNSRWKPVMECLG